MTDNSHSTTISESVEVVTKLATEGSGKGAKDARTKCAPEYDKCPGWEQRLFTRALLAQNLKFLLELTGHTQHELQLYTGLAKQTVITACSLEQNLSKLGQSAFKSNTFVLSLCCYLDSAIYNLSSDGWERERIVLKLLDRSSNKYAALSTFLQSEGLTLEQIDTYTKKLSPQIGRLHGHEHCPPFMWLWSASFEPSADDKVTRELKGLRFKDALLGTCGADSFDLTTARNVYFDLVFLRQADLGSDVFMHPLLQSLKRNKVRCLFDLEQLDRLKSLVQYDWEQALLKLKSCRDELSDPKVVGPSVNNVKDIIYRANQQLQFILLFSKLIRNLAILRMLELVPYRDNEKERPIDLLLSQKFAATDYLKQAKQLINGIIYGLNSLSKRRAINLDSARSFLQSLDESDGNPYYIFTADTSNDTITDHYHWPYNGIYPAPNYKLSLRNDDGYTLFCNPKENGIELSKDLHVLTYHTFSQPYSSDKDVISCLELLKPYDQSQQLKKSMPLGPDNLCRFILFQGGLATYYQRITDGFEYSAESFEVDKSRGGVTLLDKLGLDSDLKNVLNQLPDAYYGTVLLSPNNSYLSPSEQVEQERAEKWVAALNMFLERGGFEG